MKVFLLHRDHDFKPKPGLRDAIFNAMASGDVFAVTNARRNLERAYEKNPELAHDGVSAADRALIQDLELETLWQAMAGEDEFLYEIAKRVVLSSLDEPDAVLYRQQALTDCIEQRDVIVQLYSLALEALTNERQVGGFWVGAGPELVLRRSVQILELHVGVLKRLRQLADDHAQDFHSEAFRRFFAMLATELSDEYLEELGQHLRALEFRRGLRESAELGQGLRGRRYIVHASRLPRSWKERLPFANRPDEYSFSVHPRDEAGARALADIRVRGINSVANAAAQSADHVKSFFAMLRLELAFYLACLNLRDRLSGKGEPTCLPEPLPSDTCAFSGRGIIDICLSLHLDRTAVGNDVDAEGRSLVVITGANQGGKSTFLRSVGLAQLMLQAGMFVGAHSLRANVCSGIYTHYKREEDETMEGGKLDEELARMSAISDQITRHSLLLCNESFASTNEREGSEIARQVVRAMLAREIKVFFVTHMYDLAHGLEAEGLNTALFLRAERTADGTRTFRLREGEPLPTSYGTDSYRRIFGSDQTEPEPASSTAARR
ncbi:MAG TPA: hypothetical protein VMG74_04570 [Gaiellaceae bacterium]|nr:hypothetical protein [Gaiellaceae bacterium]